HAYEQQLCLNCHSMKHENVAGLGERFNLADGVSCESCHGPAERWLTVHYQAGFKEKSSAEKAAYGLAPTKDLAARARICADCHIGNLKKGMEVTHDLIAAGHPRLNFEYSGYLHMYNRHWLLADELARHPDFHARVWAIGQVASAAASVEQLYHRALAANKPGPGGKPWPEFTEYGCFACHKDLQVNSSRQEEWLKQGRAGKLLGVPGSLPYGTWYMSLTHFNGQLSGAQLDKPDPSLVKLKELMDRPGSPPGPVAIHARNVLSVLDQRMLLLGSSKTMSPADVRGLL